MQLTLVTKPAAEPVTLQEAKDWLRVTHVDDDQLIESLIASARNFVQLATHRQLITATWDVKFDDFESYRIRLPLPPLQSVTSIKYLDVNNVEQTLATDQYLVSTGSHESPGEVMPAQGVSWPTTRSQAFHRVTIRIVCGYGSQPEEVDERAKQAVKLLVANGYEVREPLITGTIVAQMPMSFKYLIDQLKIRRTFA